MVKIIFFDIDGTILKFKERDFTKKVYEALHACQDKGIKIFIATGRPSYVIQKFNIEFDGILAFNGQYCFDSKGHVIYKNPMDPKDVQVMIQNAKDMNKPLILCDDKMLGANYRNDIICEYMGTVNIGFDLLDNYEEFSHHELYQIIAPTNEEQTEQLLKGTVHTKSARWWPKACDIIPAKGGKGIGIQAILDYYGFTKEEAMAFGDGGNDKEMLESVGCGVAMDNAIDEVKDIADYITDSVDDDGVYTALKHFDII